MGDNINITVIEQPVDVAIAITESPVAVNIATVQGIEEAPINGTTYGRKDAAWQAVVTSVAWGGITGTLSNQTDLQTALDAKQPLDATLTSIAVLGTAADKMIYTTAVDTWAEATLTAFARTILDDANAAAVLATLGAQAALTLPLASTSGGTGVNNAGTLTLASNTTITGGGTVALGGFTLTVPATGTAALLATSNVFTANQQITKDIPSLRFTNTGSGAGDFSFSIDSTTGQWQVIEITTGLSPFFIRKGNADGLLALRSSKVGINQTNPSALLHATQDTATTNAVLEVARIEARVSTASTGGANGFGTGFSWYAETATNSTFQQQGLISTSWIDATNASRKAKMSLSAYDTAARLGIEIEASGSAAKLGFYGQTTTTQPAGIADADGTLADITTKFNSLIGKLETLGLIATV